MKYVPGLMVGQLSRSAGNTTASHNRNGSYLRTRTIPVDPATAKQLTQRNNMQELSQQWKDLTDAQRSGWTDLGAQMSRLDTQGQAYTLTGLQAYTSINRNRRLLALADLSDAPILEVVTILTTLSFTADAVAGMSVAFTPTPIGANNYLVIEATGQISAGKSFSPRSKYKVIKITAANGTSPQDTLAGYTAIYGDLAEGARINLRARIVTANGFGGVPLKATAVVTTS